MKLTSTNAGLWVTPCAALLLSGCLAKTVVDVATLPVKVASKTVDLATTSQAEADRNRGRRIRKQEQQVGELQREHGKLARQCQQGKREACAKDERVSAEMARLMPAIPVDRR